MKTFTFLISFLLLGLVSCKKDTDKSSTENKQTQVEFNSELEKMKGEFIYADSVAVFNKQNEIYGVLMNSKAKELIKKAKSINPDPYASFDVTVQADIIDNPDKEAWPQLIDIKTIINVIPSANDDGLRLN